MTVDCLPQLCVTAHLRRILLFSRFQVPLQFFRRPWLHILVCPVNVVPTPQVEVHKSHCVGTCSGELFPEEPKVVPAEMAKEASTEGPTDIQDLQNDRNYKQPFCTTLTTDCVKIPKPTIQRSPDKMAEEASTGVLQITSP